MNECNIVKDLMPLCADDIASADSRAYMEQHIASCEACRASWRRLKEELPMKEQMDTKETAAKMKKAMRKDTLKILAMTLGTVLLTLVLMACIWLYSAWEDGAFSVTKIFSAPVGERCIKVSDLSTAGLFTTDELQLRFYFKDGINRYTVDWTDVEVRWAPDGRTSLLIIQNAEGKPELRIVDQKADHIDGGTWEIPGLLPAEEEQDLTVVLADLCKNCEAFPTGWDTIEFTFYTWQEDSDTLTLKFETDNGHTGMLDYYYPTETITNITE